MSITALYQRIMQQHVQAAEMILDLADLVAAQGRDINALSTRLDEPVHVPAPIPPRSNTMPCAPPHEGARMDTHGNDFDDAPVAAEFAPDADPGVVFGIVGLPVSAVCPGALHPSEGPAVESGPAPQSGACARSEYTAAEWAMSPHFLAYMKTEPYARWPVEQQNRMRDAFVRAHHDTPPKNRWWETFSKFATETAQGRGL